MNDSNRYDRRAFGTLASAAVAVAAVAPALAQTQGSGGGAMGTSRSATGTTGAGGQPFADQKGEAEDAYKKHAQMKVQLFQVEMAAMTGENWAERVKTLTRTITNHVEEEETEIFPRMQKQLEAAQMQMLERQLMMNKRMVG